jgi:Helix-turn-helix domain
MREAAGVRESAEIFGLAEHRLRRWIAEGRIVPRACGRRSVILFDELRELIRSMPPTKSSRRRVNLQREHDHASAL